MGMCDDLGAELDTTQNERRGLLEAVLCHALNDGSENSTVATLLTIRNVDTLVSAV
jgi:hypothetical protein